MKNQAILQRIKKLAKFSRDRVPDSFEISANVDCDEAIICVNFKTGECSLSTWWISGHNGDA